MSLQEWPEIEAVRAKQRHELVLKGPFKRIPELDSEELQNAAFFEGSSVNFISITNCGLSSLRGDFLGRLSHLTRLSFASNELSSLPDVFGNLTSLKSLDVSGNKLSSLPASFASLNKLETLIATRNELKTESLFDFSGLQQLLVLDLSYNQLTAVPHGLGAGNHRLHTAIFSNNEIEELKDSFSELEQLKELNLSSNKLSDIPGPIAGLEKIKILDLSNNPFKDGRFKKLANDKRAKVSAVIAYIRKTAVHIDSKHHEQTENEDASSQPNSSGKSISVVTGLSQMTVERLPSVKDIRPYLVCCVLNKLDVSGENFKKFINIQTKLHNSSLCGNRTVSTIGTHDVSSFAPPLKYLALPRDELHITALHKKTPVSARELIEALLRDAELARKRTKRNTLNPLHRYLHLVEKLPLLPCLIDSNGLVISLAPVTNSDTTKLSENTTSVWVEVTSSESLQVCKEVMDQIVLETLQFSPEIEIDQVRVTTPEGDLVSSYPDKNDLAGLVIERKTSSD